MTENELRARVCSLAKNWVGKKEADGSYREIIDIYNQIVPLPRRYKLSYADPWCAGFVSAVAQKLGLTEYIYPECGCGPMIALYQKAGRWMENDAYVPKPGDVIFYDWQDSGVGDNMGVSDHVGIVINISGNVINIIEGNCGNAVQYTARQVNGQYIRGYGLPNYAAAASAINAHEEPEEVPDPGEVVMTALPDGYCYVPLPILSIGDDSEAVRAAQLLLKGRGFPVGWMGADGEFGPKTEAALGKFKRDRGLQRTAEIDAETWQALICK